jgi:hypothetical protein
MPTVRPRPVPAFAPGVEAAADQLSEEVVWSQPAPTQASEPARTRQREDQVRPALDEESHIAPPALPIVKRAIAVSSPAGRPDLEPASESHGRQGHTQESQRVAEERRSDRERTTTAPPAPSEREARSDASTIPAPGIVTERVTRTERVEVIGRLVRQGTSPAQPIEAPPSLIAAPASGRPDGVDRDTAEPPVQVTIGRIEVTAIAGVPAPKRKTAARPPSMSLDEYLARRRGKEASS